MTKEKELQDIIAKKDAAITIIEAQIADREKEITALKADLIQRDRIIAKKDAQVEKQYKYIQMQKQTIHKIFAKLDEGGKLDGLREVVEELVKATNKLTEVIKGE